MTYVDGYVLAVVTAKREEYRTFAQFSAAIWKECGALQVVECWGDDVPDGKLTSFPMAVKKQDDETVVFAWVVWPSKAARDEGNRKMMADPRMQPGVMPIPVDGKRMIYGGFQTFVDV